MSEPLLQAEELSAGYQGPVVGPVSFSVSAGEVVVLSGPNGCGKSTLLGAVLGHSRVFSGSLRRSSRASLACLGQQAGLPEELPMTGRELVTLAEGDPAVLPEYLGAVLHQRVDRLSGGQRQLMHVWAAIAGSARLLLLDEPTNNLDPVSESLLADYLCGPLGERGVLLVCHEPDFVARVADRVIEVR